MNPDFAIILNFKLKNVKNVDPDFLVRTARNIGARAISVDYQEDKFKVAGEKYTIKLVETKNGSNLTATNVIDTLVTNRKKGQQTIINIPIENDGYFSNETKDMLENINDWMHIFGHAFNESEPSSLKVANSGFALQNRHMNYQKYIFLKNRTNKNIEIFGLHQQPNRIEMIENRIELKFTYEESKLTIDLSNAPHSNFTWQVLRIQEHRPEDDLKETKY